MKKVIALSIAVGISFAGVTGEAHHAEHPHWGYNGKEGPAHWSDIDPKFRMCRLGVNQSPVDLHRFVDANLSKLKIYYAGIAHDVVNNGHTIKITTQGRDEVVVDGKKFNLIQFHFHTPSEHTINGKHYPLEGHFVHKSKDGEYLVIAIMYKEGKHNKALQKVLNDMSAQKGKVVKLKEMFNPGELFPHKLDYYRYEGSFTTPPCTEGVRWIVIKMPVEASKEQIEAIHKVVGNNNRPTQPLKARVILK